MSIKNVEKRILEQWTTIHLSLSVQLQSNQLCAVHNQKLGSHKITKLPGWPKLQIDLGYYRLSSACLPRYIFLVTMKNDPKR